MRRAALAVLLLVVGCGGANGGDRTKYVHAGNRICSDYDTAIGKLGQPTALGEIGPYIGKALPVLTRAVDRLHRLDPPADLAGRYATFMDAATATLDRAKALRAAAGRADAAEVQRLLKEATRAGRARVGLARAAGLEACAKV